MPKARITGSTHSRTNQLSNSAGMQLALPHLRAKGPGESPVVAHDQLLIFPDLISAECLP